MAKIKIIITDTPEQIGMTGKTNMRKKLQEFLDKEDKIKILESGVSEMESINGIKSEYDYLIIENDLVAGN
jgi:hypothetical protein